MKKLIGFLLTLLLFFLVFLIFFFKNSNYKIKYKIHDILVTEKYNQDCNCYQFILTYNKNNYSFISYDKYINKRKLIDDIKITNDDKLVCLNIKSKYIKTYPLCSKNNNLISPFYSNQIKSIKKDSYEQIKIYDLDQKKYLLWNYDGFVFLNQKNKKKLKVFNKDVYNLDLVYNFEKYLLVPDYEQKYKFSKLYLIDLKKGTFKQIELDYELYFNSVFLGNKKHNVYIYDKKAQQEYYLNLKNGKMFKTENKILVNGKWQKVSLKKLEQGCKFYQQMKYSYKIVANKLYSFIDDNKYLTLISNLDVTQIIKISDLEVYFISDDSLYVYNPLKGFKKLLSFSEWNFNNQNMIFIYD